MRLPWRDASATLFVALGVAIYAAWALGSPVPGFGSPGSIAVAVLVLGLAGCAPAVIPGFDELLHGSRTYLALAAALGLIAMVSGVWCLVTGDAVALGILVAATVVLWAVSTVRHLRTQAPQARLGQS